MSTVRYIGQCDDCTTPRAVDTAGPLGEVDGLPFFEWLRRYGLSCRICGAQMVAVNFQRLEGSYSAAAHCDPRCTTATGHVCVCQCAGANHGADWR